MSPIEHSLSGLDLHRLKDWTKKYPQFPTDEDIRSMSGEIREELLAIIPDLQGMNIGALAQTLEVQRMLQSIEEELDSSGTVEQRLKAVVTLFRQAALHLLPCDPTEKPISGEMLIFPMRPLSNPSLRQMAVVS
jgi:hypothetical protein